MTESRPLPKREMQILAMIGEGLSNEKIAARLGLCFDTVRTHRQHIYRYLNVNNHQSAMVEAWKMGLVDCCPTCKRKRF
jgi:DNA-binding NarL/FixJ family response regulator